MWNFSETMCFHLKRCHVKAVLVHCSSTDKSQTVVGLTDEWWWMFSVERTSGGDRFGPEQRQLLLLWPFVSLPAYSTAQPGYTRITAFLRRAGFPLSWWLFSVSGPAPQIPADYSSVGFGAARRFTESLIRKYQWISEKITKITHILIVLIYFMWDLF